jgi:hypothetical protein
LIATESFQTRWRKSAGFFVLEQQRNKQRGSEKTLFLGSFVVQFIFER